MFFYVSKDTTYFHVSFKTDNKIVSHWPRDSNSKMANDGENVTPLVSRLTEVTCMLGNWERVYSLMEMKLHWWGQGHWLGGGGEAWV
jgi:hypothetical protein